MGWEHERSALKQTDFSGCMDGRTCSILLFINNKPCQHCPAADLDQLKGSIQCLQSWTLEHFGHVQDASSLFIKKKNFPKVKKKLMMRELLGDARDDEKQTKFFFGLKLFFL